MITILWKSILADALFALFGVLIFLGYWLGFEHGCWSKRKRITVVVMLTSTVALNLVALFWALDKL